MQGSLLPIHSHNRPGGVTPVVEGYTRDMHQFNSVVAKRNSLMHHVFEPALYRLVLNGTH